MQPMPPEGQGGYARKVADTAAERDRLKVANAELLASAEEVESLLKFAFDEGALSSETIMGLCVDPYDVLCDLRAAIARARELTP